MAMRTDSFTSGPPLGPAQQESTMAKKKSGSTPMPHHAQMATTMQAGMRRLSESGGQTVSVDFAELQNEGYTAAAPRSYPAKKAGS
jgi:uncharacterized iron-regulated membrane protein